MSQRILVVDDDVAVRESLADALRDIGSLEIGTAASAEAVLGVLDTGAPPPDIVLTDLRMRGLDGLDLLRVLRQRVPSTRVVLMTAYHDVGTAVGAMREGASDFLCKPFDLNAVREVMGRLLGRVDPVGAESENPDRSAGVQASAGRESTGAAVHSSSRDPADGVRARGGPPRLLAGRYRIEDEIGRGAMATVFRALDGRHHRSVAVKVLRREVAASIGVERFLREIRVTARLHHPHVLTLIDSGEWDGIPFYVMPFVEGASLRSRMQTRRFPVAEAAALLRDVADALAAAHALGIVHRDIKPENILLSGSHAWVADFGVARAVSGAAGGDGTLAGSVIGTPGYMAPEQIMGEADIDHRADLYGLGVMAFEILAGRPPFARGSARAVLAAHLASEPPSLRSIRSEIPPGLEEIVQRCLAKRATDRWTDAATLAHRFAAFASRRDERL